MPVVVYSVLRLVLLAVSWLLLTWVGLHPIAALLVAAFVAWGLSYAALGGPRDAAARYLAERAAVRAAHAGRPVLSAGAQQDADVEDAAVDAALGSPRETAGGSDDARDGRVRADRPAGDLVGERVADDEPAPAAASSPDADRGAPQADGGPEADDPEFAGPELARPDDGGVDPQPGRAQSASASPSSMP